MRKALSGVLSAGLVLGFLLATPAAARASTAGAIAAAPTHPIAGETFAVTGALPTPVVRPVTLQARSGKHWKTLGAASTTAAGSFSLSAVAKKSVTVRVVAAAVTVGTTAYPKLTTGTTRVSLAHQSATFRLGSSPAGAPVSVSATLSPLRAGRPVQLQIKQGSRWQTVASGSESASATGAGSATLTFTPPTAGTFRYRVYLPVWNGAAAVSSGQKKIRIYTAAAQIAAGMELTCAVTGTGATKCWGWNGFGQLADGSEKDRSVPTQARGLTSGITKVTGSGLSTCVLTTAGGVECWGVNMDGALGDGTTVDRAVPGPVVGLGTGVTSLGASDAACAVTSAGAVKCWGANDDGEVGDGTKDARTTPTQVVGLTSGATAVAVGGEHACAITSGGGVKCWGRNNNGELGDGTTTNRTTPVQVVGLSSGVIAITAGEYHTCAITAGGRLVCWGDNGSGQLGDGTTTMRTTPVQVTGLTAGVEAVSGGFLHTCAVTAGGSAKCWGANRLADDDDTAGGQLGDGTYTGRTTPTQVKGLTSGVVGISAGEYHSCATLRTGGARCWGWNSSGELGNNTRKRSNVPVRVVGFG